MNEANTAPSWQPPGEVKFIYEVGPDGVERIFLSMAELVRARVAQSVLSLRVLAQYDREQCPNGLPVIEVNGLQVELQGYDESRRRWWAEILEVTAGESATF